MKLVSQESDWDCGVACTAMITGESIPFLKDRFRNPDISHGEEGKKRNDGYERFGWCMNEIMFVLFTKGIPFFQTYLQESIEAAERQNGQNTECWSCPSLRRDFRDMGMYFTIDEMIRRSHDWHFLVGVKSKTTPGAGHWIILADQQFYDPKQPDPFDAWSEPYEINSGILVFNPK